MNQTIKVGLRSNFARRTMTGLRIAASASALLLIALLGAAADKAKAPDAAAPEFSPQEFQENVKYLASEKLKGRGNGMPELNRAAKYIAGRFKQAGLEPAGDKGSYFQNFVMTTGVNLKGKNSLAFRTAAGEKRLLVKKDYIPISFSAAGTFDAPLAFAGYGITAPNFHYDDYAGLDVKGKVVIVLRHEPQESDEKSVFSGKESTQHSEIRSKAINARNHGAVAMILVNDTGAHPDKQDELIQFGSLYGPEEMKFAALMVKADQVDSLLKPSGKTLDELRRAIDKDLSNQSFALDPTLGVNFTVGIQRTRKQVANVVGLLRGSDPKLRDQALVIGAHYDHLGLGGQGGSMSPSQAGQIHHGADDNASGTAGVMELARIFAQERASLRRSVLFMAYSGEELGLLGSAYYVQQPLVPLDRTIAMLNLDMIGRVAKNKLTIGGTGTSPDFKKIVEEANRNVGFELAFSASGYGASDHMSFTVHQVPVLFFFSGLHADYHKPSDTWEKIDPASGVKVAQLVAAVARDLDNVKDKPLYVRVAEPAGRGAGGGGGYGPYFGSIPDMSDSTDGVKFSDVRDGSPAAKAGFKAGDKLVDFDGMKVENLEEFTYALRQHKPGDKINVTVIRNGERMTREVTLEVRK